MTAALVIAILSTIDKLIDLYALMMSRASDEDAEKLLAVIVEREEWWQRNLWGPIGRWLESLGPPEP